MQLPIGLPTDAVAHRVGAALSSYRVLYSFGATSKDGLRPDASLIDVNGTLYGPTWYGGKYDKGTVFSFNTAGVERVVYSFGSSDDGESPDASLIDVNGTLYGTTYYGGAYLTDEGGRGTVFNLTTTGRERVLHSFGSGSDGVTPQASLIEMHGKLYGTTAVGGPANWGTVFSISKVGTERALYSFTGFSGGIPEAALIDVTGTLYGTTAFGGAYGEAGGGDGTVFSVTKTGTEQVLHSFGNGADGIEPAANLIDVKGTLYGTTLSGGAYDSGGGGGTVFSISTTGLERVLHNFGNGSDGEFPSANLLNVNGTLYGTTYAGGAHHDDGTVFSISTTGEEHVLHSFDGHHDGEEPSAGLIDVKGTLYGTTYAGGTYGYGTVFALRLQ
ncbi:MAG: choice-of-anchor tandem repeat GloVer-containing protein [Candidatus Cybelea sp.]